MYSLYMTVLQVTTHSHLLSYDEVKEVQKALGFKDGNVMPFLLQDFDTELHFSSKVGYVFAHILHCCITGQYNIIYIIVLQAILQNKKR